MRWSDTKKLADEVAGDHRRKQHERVLQLLKEGLRKYPEGNFDPKLVEAIISSSRASFLAQAQQRGIVVPAEYIITSESPDDAASLTPEGTAWVKHQLRVDRRTEVKEWIAILSPVLSLVFSSVIAILSLLVALRKK